MSADQARAVRGESGRRRRAAPATYDEIQRYGSIDGTILCALPDEAWRKEAFRRTRAFLYDLMDELEARDKAPIEGRRQRPILRLVQGGVR
jgi:hypothetical protein